MGIQGGRERGGEECGGLVILRNPVYRGGKADATHRAPMSLHGQPFSRVLRPDNASVGFDGEPRFVSGSQDIAHCDEELSDRDGEYPQRAGVNCFDTGLVADYEWDRDNRTN